MFYKNEDIKKLYKWNFVLLIVGAVILALGSLLIICGFVFGTKAYNNRGHIDDALARSGNHATKAVYFEITKLPIEAASDKHGTYYLLTDGKEYRLGRLESEMYDEIKNEIESNGSFKFEGLTLYIVNDDTNEDIATIATVATWQDVNTYNMNDILGDVYIDYLKLSYGSVLWKGYNVNFVFGLIFFLIGYSMVKVNAACLINSRKITSISNITADEIDKEAGSKDTHWYNRWVIATPSFLVGFTGDSDSFNDSQMAFRYEDIKRIYGVNKPDLNGVQPNKIKNRYQIIIEAIDGNKYSLSDVSYYIFERPYYPLDMNRLFERIKEHNPTVEYGPENTQYKTYRFTCHIVDYEEDEEYEEKYVQELTDDMRENICYAFDAANVIMRYQAAEQVVSAEMKFVGDREVEVKVGFFAESDKEIEETLYDFLKNRLKEGMYSGDCDVEFVPVE